MKLVRPPLGTSLPNHSMMSISVPCIRGARGVTGVGRLHPQRGVLALERLELDAGRDHAVGDGVRAWVPMLAFSRYLNLPKILSGLPGFFGLHSELRSLSTSTLSWAVPPADLDGLGVALGALALGLGLVGLLAVLPLGEVELGPAELVAEVLVGPPAVGADGGARGARAVDPVAHRAPADRGGHGEDDTALLVDLALVGGHPAGAGLPLEDDLLAFLARAVLADDGPLGLLELCRPTPGPMMPGTIETVTAAFGAAGGGARTSPGRRSARRHDAGGRHDQARADGDLLAVGEHAPSFTRLGVGLA